MAEKKYRSIDEITYNGKALREILEAHHEWFESRGEGFRGEIGIKAELRGADLKQTDLSGRWLHHANLSNAILTDANLGSAKLFNTNLSQADMEGASLYSADLYWTNLSGARLRKAGLFGARLMGTKLAGADLSESLFGLTTITDCDLSAAIGLETVGHLEPSSIGVDTILKSKGKIPEAFLKGAGLPDIWIQYVKALTENPIEFYSCFISHSDQDKEFCERLYVDLKAKDVRCWYFPEDATWGKSVWGEIDRAVKVYDKLVVVCSEHSLNSGPVIREIERALQREDREKREILFPIRIDDYLLEKWDHPRKADVVAKVVGNFRGWKDHEQYKKNFPKLLKALNSKQPE